MEEVDFITAVRNAAYNEYGAITCEVQFEGAVDTRGEPIWSPFTATDLDVTDYGKKLYNSLVNGEYGECIDSLEVRKKPGGHWIIRDLTGLDLVGLASL